MDNSEPTDKDEPLDVVRVSLGKPEEIPILHNYDKSPPDDGDERSIGKSFLAHVDDNNIDEDEDEDEDEDDNRANDNDDDNDDDNNIDKNLRVSPDEVKLESIRSSHSASAKPKSFRRKRDPSVTIYQEETLGTQVSKNDEENSTKKSIKPENRFKSFVEPTSSQFTSDFNDYENTMKNWNDSKYEANFPPSFASRSTEHSSLRKSIEGELCLRDSRGIEKTILFLNRMKSVRLSNTKMNKNVKGKRIKKEHELYTLSIAVMLGLRYAIYQTHLQLRKNKEEEEDKKWLNSQEFMHTERYIFYPDGRKNTPPHKLGHAFKFKDYAPMPFAYIRRMFGINEYGFIESVCANADFIEFMSNSKSGQFFFYSSDGKYMIKTMSNTESKFLLRILPHYFRHCAQNPNTLITKFLGMYRVKLSKPNRNVKFIIMNSVFDTDKMISSFYDLKGSTFGRDARPGESVKKDNDVRRMIKEDPNNGFILPPSVRTRMREQLIQDCNFLKGMKIFDYSMLIGTHHIPSSSHSNSNLNPNHPPFNAIIGKGEVVKSTNRKTQSDSDLMNRRLILEHKELAPRNHKSVTQLMTSPIKLKNFELRMENNRISIMKRSEESFYRSFRRVRSGDSGGGDGDGDDDDSKSNAKSNGDSSDGGDDDDGSYLLNSDVIQNEHYIQETYWPFHRYYEMDGKFRSEPMANVFHKSLDHVDNDNENNDNDGDNDEAKSSNPPPPEIVANCASCLGDQKGHNHDKSAVDDAVESFDEKIYQLKDFEQPISDREDGGLLMDISKIDVPSQVEEDGEEGEDGIDNKLNQQQNHKGKIFYMGVIDILQQYDIRKQMEKRYKKVRGYDGISCVHPESYADRFIQFFDEYTAARNTSTNTM